MLKICLDLKYHIPYSYNSLLIAIKL